MFLIPLAKGQQAYVHGLVFVICALTFISIIFSETAHWILKKFHTKYPGMALSRNSEEFDSDKNSDCHSNKTEKCLSFF